jgi:hypothetical protein
LRRSILFLAASLALLAPLWPPGSPQLAHADDKAEASRHFKLGVRLYAETKYDEALIEFQRAYELAPHPSVLYNIAVSHRELSHYGEAIQYFQRFLSEGKGVAKPELLARAKVELDELRGRIGSVVVDVAPAGVLVTVDGREVGTTPIDAPVIVGPGRHTFALRAPWGQVETRTLTIAAGDKELLTLTMTATAEGATTDTGTGTTTSGTGMTGGTGSGTGRGTGVGIDTGAGATDARPIPLGVSASMASNLRQLPDTGAPVLGAHLRLGSRLVAGVDLILVAWAVIPSLRVDLGGSRTSVHAIAALPIDATDTVFVAGAAGLGLRHWLTQSLTVRLEALVTYAGSDHGVSLPVFLGVELWR